MFKLKVRPKYIAKGFNEDASTLLNRFTDMSTVQFADFAKIWREHHFSLIFMGRPDQIENNEFTNEVFKISTKFLSSTSFYMKVGAVYLLYSLYLNQISDPFTKIRLEIAHWQIIKSLRIEAISNKYRTLHYVIDYLMKNALMYVAHQILMGPHTSCMPTVSKNEQLLMNLKANYKSGLMEYSNCNNLQRLQDLQNQYLEEKEKLDDDIKQHMSKGSRSFEEFDRELQNLVNPPSSICKMESVGNRRAKIKAKAFQKRTITRYGDNADDEICDNPPTANKRFGNRKKGTRLPASERRVGRPPKNPKPIILEPESEEEDDIDISHLLSQQQELYLPPVESEYKKCRTRRERYYKESPKRDDDDESDHENTV